MVPLAGIRRQRCQQHHWLHRTWCNYHLNALLNLLGNALVHPNKLGQACNHRGLGLMRESRLDSGRPVAKIVKICCEAHFFTILARSPNSSSRCVRAGLLANRPRPPTLRFETALKSDLSVPLCPISLRSSALWRSFDQESAAKKHCITLLTSLRVGGRRLHADTQPLRGISRTSTPAAEKAERALRGSLFSIIHCAYAERTILVCLCSNFLIGFLKTCFLTAIVTNISTTNFSLSSV